MTIYKKTIKGTEEVAFKSYGLSERLRPYLTLADGINPVVLLEARHPTLTSMALIMKSLADEGYLEAVAEPAQEMAQASDKVLPLPLQRVANGMNVARPAMQAAPMQQPPAYPPAPVRSTPVQQHTERISNAQLEAVKSEMVRDISAMLGKDAALVINKINSCTNINDLFASMMGLKKVIGMYAGTQQADKFANKYAYIASL